MDVSIVISIIGALVIFYYLFIKEDQRDFQRGYDWAMESHMSGIPVCKIQQDIDMGMDFDPTDFDRGAQAYIDSLEPEYKCDFDSRITYH